ncbi:MAG: tripartite tricarboxylate transporter TctB family protein [Burkholderiales bacterium]
MKLRSRRDFFAGLIFLAFGVIAAVVARDYPIGSAVRMGPGYFPLVLGCILALLGLVVIGRGLLRDGPAPERTYWRPLTLILVAIAVFAASVESLGIAPATALLVAIGATASPESRRYEALLLVAVLVLFTLAVFVYGLKLPFKVWPI